MTFDEVKLKIEFGLAILGYDAKGYTVVDDFQWIEREDACIHDMHPMLQARSCNGCKSIWIPAIELENLTDEILAVAMHRLTQWMSKEKTTGDEMNDEQ